MWWSRKNKDENKCEKVEEVKEEVKELIAEDDGLDFLDEESESKSDHDEKTKAYNNRVNEVVKLVQQRDIAHEHMDRANAELLNTRVMELTYCNPQLARVAVSVLNESINSKFSEEELNEYIWIEGFKGTDKEMKCRGHKFELGEVSRIGGDIEICKNGFHFCTELKHVMSYYPLVTSSGVYSTNRFFKIRAKVKRKDYLASKGEYIVNYEGMPDRYRGARYTHSSRFSIMRAKTDKLVTGEIEFLEEVGYSEIEPIIKSSILSKRIKNELDWEQLKKVGSILELDRGEFKKGMKSLGFSDGVITALYKKISSNIKIDSRIGRIKDIIEYVGGLVDMDVSTDMLVFLTIEKIDELTRIEIEKARVDEYMNRRRF